MPASRCASATTASSLRPGSNFQAAADLAVDLNGNLDFIFAGKFLVVRRPAGSPKPFAVAEHLPQFFGRDAGSWAQA